MKLNNIQNIRFKLLVPFAISLVAYLLTVVWSLQHYQHKEESKLVEETDSLLEESFNRAITEESNLLKNAIFFISNNKSIQSLWLKKNKEELYRETLPIFEKLKNDYFITHFYFHKTDDTNFLRVHKPEHYGDTITRATFVQAREKFIISSGIELGIFKTLVLRVVSPWIIDNKLVGYIELGSEIDHVIEKISEDYNYKLILALDENFARQNNVQTSPGNISYATATTNEIDKTSLLNILNDNSSERVFSLNNKNYLVSDIKVKDFSKNHVATLTYFHDISYHSENHQGTIRTIAINSTLISILILFFYYVYSGKIQNWLTYNYKKLQDEISDRKIIQEALTENKAQLEELIYERDQSLDESRKRYQALFDKTADALFILDGHNFIDCNQATLDMFGYDKKEEIYNLHPSQLSPEFQPDGQASEMKANVMIGTAFEKSSNRFEWDHMTRNGAIFPAEVLLTAIPFGEKQLLHAVVRDITERKAAAKEIEYQAYYDSLTELPNRKLLLDRLKQALITSRRHKYYDALLFVDLDRFKTINDSLGHSIGDRILIEAAKRIKACLWDEDTAARFGGDEFVILLRHLGTEKEAAGLSAEKVARRIQESFKKPFLIKDNELHVSTSIGIALFPFQEESIEDIIKHADTAMYSAKENGRNQVAFYLSQMHDKVVNRLNLEKDLRTALRDNQLDVYYQPQLNNDGRVIGVEALIRWQHPTHGFINPEEFIAIAEDIGLIYEIGDFVIQKSITDILGLNKEKDISLNLSVNISPNQFKKSDFVSKIKNIVENHQLEKYFLTLELTESIAIDNLNETVEKFEKLRHAGVRLSLDDFGTGYSSLSHLKRLPIDELKIDKSFVFDIEDDPQDALLVQTIIKIAHQFGLDTVAEGVETKEHVSFLEEESCTIYQGYFYSRPLPIDQLREFIDTFKEQLKNRKNNNIRNIEY